MPRFRPIRPGAAGGDWSPLVTPHSQREPFSGPRAETEQRTFSTSCSATGRTYPAIYGTIPLSAMLANIYADPSSPHYYFNYMFSRGPCSIADLKVNDTAIASVDWIDLWDTKDGDNVQTINSVWDGRVPTFVETYPGRCGVWFRAVEGPSAIIPGTITVTATLTRDPLSNYGSGTGDSSKLDLICYDIWTNKELWKLDRDPSEIDTTSWQAFGTWSHTDFSGVPRFSFNGPIYEEDQETALKLVLSHGRAQHYMHPDDGKTYIWYWGTATPTGESIGAGDWIDGPYSNHRPEQSQSTEVTVSYYNPDDGPDSLAREKDDTADPQIGPDAYDMQGLNYPQALRWAQSEHRHQTLEPLNWGGTVKRLAGSKLGDVITMTTRDGYISGQLVRIVGFIRNLEGTCRVELNEYDAAAQSTATDVADTPPATGPLTGSQPPAGTYVRSLNSIYDTLSQQYTWHRYTWTAPSDPEYYEFQLWVKDTTWNDYALWVVVPAADYEAMRIGALPANSNFQPVAPMPTTTTYLYQLYLVNRYNGRRTLWTQPGPDQISSGSAPTIDDYDVMYWTGSVWDYDQTFAELTKQISSGAISITRSEVGPASKVRVFIQVESGTEDDLDSFSAPDGIVAVLISDDSAKTINVIPDAATSDPIRLNGMKSMILHHKRDTLTLGAASTGARELARSYNEGLIEEDLRVATFFLGPASSVPRVRQFKTDGGAPASIGTFLYWFEDAKYQHLFFNAQLPHARLNESDIYPHIHYVVYNNQTGTFTIEFEFEYAWANIDGTFPTNNTVVTITDTLVNPVTGTHYVAWGSAITGTGFVESSMLVCRVSRDATASSSDTYPDDIGILEFDLHFSDTGIGSYEG